MKWVLLMQLIFDGYKAGGTSIDSMYFETEAQCQAVARVFLNNHEPTSHSIIHDTYDRKATCIKLK